MNELRRILANKRRLVLLIALPVLTVALFLFERMGGEIRGGAAYLAQESADYRQNVTRFAQMTPEEAEADRSELYLYDGGEGYTLRSTKLHTAGYAEYLENVQYQAERMSSSSVFGRNKNSFTYRNIQKTARDFKKLAGVEPEFGGNRAVELWVDFKLGDAAYLFAVLILVLAFFEEKRSGVLPTVRACPAGRKELALSRLGVLLVWCAAFTVLLYAGTLAVSFALYGGTDTLSHPVQSIEMFKTCTLRVTIGEWIALYFAAKLLCGFLIGLIFWFILSFLSQTQLAWIAIIAILAAEYAAWAFIPTQMALSVFRYVNVFSYVFPAEALGKYANMNFFGLPVRVLDLLIALFVLLAGALSFGVVMISVKRRPMGNRDLLGRAVSVFNRAADAVRSRLSITGMEGYKQLILGGAALFILAAAVAAPRLGYVGYSKKDGNAYLYIQYLNEVKGPVNDATYAYLERASENIEEYSGAGDYQAALYKLDSQLQTVTQRAAEGGYEPWLLNDYRVDEIMGESSLSIHRWNGIVAAAFVILCAAPVFALEKRWGTERILRTARRGRGRVFASKYVIVIIEVLAIFALIYTRQVIRSVRYLGADTLGAPIQNAEAFADCRLPITLGAAFTAMYAIRLAALIAVGLITAFISARSKTWEKAALAGFALILVPGLLLYFGAEWAGFVSIVPGISAADVLMPNARGAAIAAVTAAIIAASVIITLIERKRIA